MLGVEKMWAAKKSGADKICLPRKRVSLWPDAAALILKLHLLAAAASRIFSGFHAGFYPFCDLNFTPAILIRALIMLS